MTRIWKILNLVVLGLLMTICLLGTFYKHISFGKGLGDIFGYLFLYFTTLIHFILTVVSRKKGTERYKYFTFIFLTLMIYICYKATLGRGDEYSWDGNLFYLPCSKEIKIENHDVKKEIQVSMCSMVYYSTFKAEWNGHFMVLIEGGLKIPDDLKEYIEYPIKYIEIQPEYFEQLQSDSLVKIYFIDTDTLVINKTYNLSGEIMKVKNSKPVMEVTINK